MNTKEYVESFGWTLDELTEEELTEAKEELRDIKKGALILDSVLSRKTLRPKFEKGEEIM